MVTSETKPIYPARFSSKIYSFLIKSKFKNWGKDSYIQFPSTIRNPQTITIGMNVFIREHRWLNVSNTRTDDRATLIIGNNTYIGRFTQINALSDVIIESNVLIADRVFISDVDHSFEDVNTPIIFQKVRSKGPVKLKTGCWIGIGAVILPGVTIGENSIVGANAVVTHDVPPNTIVTGIPAKLLKKIG